VDEGWFDGIESLASSSTWLAGAGVIVLLFGVGIGAFLYIRNRRRNKNLFGLGLANNGEGARGSYAPVSEDVPMGLLERGRRKLGVSRGGTGAAAGTKELYDAFGDGPSDDESDDGLNERTALRYHDEFLDDEEHQEGGQVDPAQYRDEPHAGSAGGSGGGEEKEERKEQDDVGRRTESHAGSSGSWEDAAEDVGRS
jgi:kexin